MHRNGHIRGPLFVPTVWTTPEVIIQLTLTTNLQDLSLYFWRTPIQKSVKSH